MTRRGLKLLKKAIEHWRDNVRKAEEGTLTIADISSEMCPLCNVYKDCEGYRGRKICPVYQKTGDEDCHGTPYYTVRGFLDEFMAAVANFSEKLTIQKKLVKACRKELNFLISLQFEKENA
jgi:hypothetical protein